MDEKNKDVKTTEEVKVNTGKKNPFKAVNVDDKTISLSSYDTIYLGDDFVLFNKDNEVIQYVLNYDTRAEEEIKLIIDSIN